LKSSLPDDIAEAFARASGRTGIFQPHHVQWLEQVESTNDRAHMAARLFAPEGAVIGADAQTAGRGRLGRRWASPPGAGLYVSVILRPQAPAALITIAAGVAIADGIETATGLPVSLKWPNDVYAGPRKLAGILAEAGSHGAEEYVVLGFGINLFLADLPPDVAARATSIEGELGRPAERGLVLVECLAALSARYKALERGGAADLVAAWRLRAAPHLGRIVEWDADGGTRRGTAHDIDAGGALLVRLDDQLVRVISGEVRWI